MQFNQPAGVTDYVNSLWKLQENPYGGDAANSYNDGPPTPGAKPMGPFYELESSSPAAALAPGKSLTHVLRTIHLSGSESALDAIAKATLGVSLAEIKTAFKKQPPIVGGGRPACAGPPRLDLDANSCPPAKRTPRGERDPDQRHPPRRPVGRVLAEHDVLVGLSIDGPAELHDKYRRDRGNGPTFDAVMRGLDVLEKHGVRFNTLTVVQRDNASHPLEVYRFLKSIESHYMQFIPIVERVAAAPDADGLRLVAPGAPDRARVSPWSVEPEQYGESLCAIFDEWVRRDVARYYVQAFDVALEAWCGLPSSLCVFAETCGHTDSLSVRPQNKTALPERVGLPVLPDIPVLGMVTRMDVQKGVDIALKGLKLLGKQSWQLVPLGAGDPKLEKMARDLQAEMPDRVRVETRYDAKLARQIYGGADVFLMPSRYEPCGISQMISMRYGCLPLVRAVGGLHDTVKDGETGFAFTEAKVKPFNDAIRRALIMYPDRTRWAEMQKAGMALDPSAPCGWSGVLTSLPKRMRTAVRFTLPWEQCFN